MAPDQIDAYAAVGHAGEKDSIGIDMVASLHVAKRSEDDIRRIAGPPITHRHSRARQDVLLIESGLPAVEIGFSGKSGAMQAENKGIGRCRLVPRRHIERIAKEPPSHGDRHTAVYATRLVRVHTVTQKTVLHRMDISVGALQNIREDRIGFCPVCFLEILSDQKPQ